MHDALFLFGNFHQVRRSTAHKLFYLFVLQKREKGKLQQLLGFESATLGLVQNAWAQAGECKVSPSSLRFQKGSLNSSFLVIISWVYEFDHRL